MNKQQIIDSIVETMREHFRDARKAQKRGNQNTVVAAFKSARECREQLWQYMDEEGARQLYIRAYDEIFEIKKS